MITLCDDVRPVVRARLTPLLTPARAIMKGMVATLTSRGLGPVTTDAIEEGGAGHGAKVTGVGQKTRLRLQMVGQDSRLRLQ